MPELGSRTLRVPNRLLAGVPGSPRLWAMLGAACICAIGFFLVVDFVFADAGHGRVGATAFDQRIAEFFPQIRTAALTGRVVEVSALGSAPVLLVLALLAYLAILGARDWLGALHLSIALLGASVFSRLLQGMFERARPEDLLPHIVVTHGSFPSAHLFGATACYATFAFFYGRYATHRGSAIACYVLATILVLLIGVTRVYLGAHHTTDVIAGIAAGAAWAFLVAAVFSLGYGRVQNLS